MLYGFVPSLRRRSTSTEHSSTNSFTTNHNFGLSQFPEKYFSFLTSPVVRVDSVTQAPLNKTLNVGWSPLVLRSSSPLCLHLLWCFGRNTPDQRLYGFVLPTAQNHSLNKKTSLVDWTGLQNTVLLDSLFPKFLVKHWRFPQ